MAAFRVAMRVDASAPIGLGHLQRCLSLAHALRALGAEAQVLARHADVDVASLCNRAGIPAVLIGPVANAPLEPSRLDDDAAHIDAEATIAALADAAPDWVLVDHYGLDARWHERVASALGCRIAVIDDLADRPLRADFLVNHNLDPDHRARYGAHHPAPRPLLGGPRYALLGPAYAAATPRPVRDTVNSIGIFMGGADWENHSLAALEACRVHAGFEGAVEVVTTRANRHREALAEAVARWPRTTLSIDLPDLRDFFARHDLQVGAGGGATWERCCLGVPAVVLPCAPNQWQVIEMLSAQRVVRAVPPGTDARELGRVVGELTADAPGRQALAAASRALVDGQGATRVARAMRAMLLRLDAATPQDAELVHAWRSAESTWRYFRQIGAPAFDDHRRWWDATLADPARHLFIARCGAQAVGVLRLDRRGPAAEVSLYLDPALTGAGLGAALLASGVAWTRTERPDLGHLVAEVHPDNTASRRLFAAVGFTAVDDAHWQLALRAAPREKAP
jgi:UDP-2,4-diacetamido-2,4,6-trideoxy-beta-L-altropyranose hydrolase